MLENGLPTRDADMQLLRDLIGTDVIVRAGKLPAEAYILAEFVTDENQLMVACGADLAFCAYASAALSQVPKAVADDALKAKELEAHHVDTVREIINIVSSLFNVEKMPHMRLREMARKGSPKYVELQQFVAQHPQQTHHEVSFPRYGVGTLFFSTSYSPGVG